LLPDLSLLLELIKGEPAYRQLLANLQKQKNNEAEVLNAARPFLIAALYRELHVPLLVVTAQPENAKKLYEQLLNWLDAGVLRIFPELDTLPYERMAPDATTQLERIQTLASLTNFNSAVAEPPLILTSAPALISKIPSYKDFISACHNIKAGLNIKPITLLENWEAMGYEMENLVEVPGTMSHRGGIVDIYPPTSEMPVRIEFFGDTVDSIRFFDTVSQRSITGVDAVTICPATEMLAMWQQDTSLLEITLKSLDPSKCNDEFQDQLRQDMALIANRQDLREAQFYAPLFNHDSLLDYLPSRSLLVLDEATDIEKTIAEVDTEAEKLRQDKLERGELPSNFPVPYFSWGELETEIQERCCLRLAAWGVEANKVDFTSAPGFMGKLPLFLQRAEELISQHERVIVVSTQASRLSELLEEKGLIIAPVDKVSQLPVPGALVLVQGSLPEGWVMGKETHLFTDAEIFGFVKQRRFVKKRAMARHKLMVDIKPGDFVVHIEHGIARFGGFIMRNMVGTEKEYLVLQYAAGDTLYVPADQVDRVSRYVGASDKTPVLNRLGTQEWSRSRQKAQEAAEELARELLALYASREIVPGYAFSRDTLWQQELEASFPYVETPDQLEAQEDVKADMEKTKPMDRLVCGDVGYGKTEVAVRAAFKAVMDGKQVAVLVPTTVLAQQHYSTFTQRFKAFPLKVDVLSRFRSAAEQREVLERLAAGAVDVCIGTHRLLQKDVVFKNLGLLIIDEEQRFGVGHKEYLKRMRQEVDVLTLSATPIPRTLHLSLVGVRDMSTMETPPENRQPVKTYVAEYSDHLVRDAIIRELERNGQVFFVHNRVQSIMMIAERLRLVVPEAKVGVAHGQMPEEELEKVMTDFSQGKIDVLLCTTIIESGLDIPNVNTLIINQADRFGLTQLYQLRGRVGRGTNMAYAYLLYDGGKRLTPAARKRLQTVYEATELGAGFNIAMKDLEIRGAGTILGAKQSGHITAVGFNLYTRLLADAVEQRKAVIAGIKEPLVHLPPATVDLPLNAYIPESYVSDADNRMELYRELAKPEIYQRLNDVRQEYQDRFGPLPLEVKNLLYVVRIKGEASQTGVESVSIDDGHILLRRFEGLEFDKRKFDAVKDSVTVGRVELRLNYRKLGKQWPKVLEEVLLTI
jgi:transcription-repair coupling factor (superfamily II helicase)